MKKTRIVIVGAGFGGLSAACLLAQQGYGVTVVEKNESAGGRGRVWKKGGFTFDMGPSWYLMRDVFERFFAHFGKKLEDFYRLVRLDPSYRIFFGQDDVIDIAADLEKNLTLFEQLETGAALKLKAYLENARYHYDSSVDTVLYREMASPKDLFSKKLMQSRLKIPLFKNIEQYVSSFFKDERLKKILMYNIVFLGGTPKMTPALYSIMAHVDFNLGVWYPQGGMGSVVRGIENLARSLGVEFVFNAGVKRITVENGHTTGIVLQDERKIQSDLVVVNADYAHGELDLLEDRYRSYSASYWEKRTIAPSAFIVYLGINKKLENLAHHNLFLEHDWVKHFDTIFEKPSWPESPSYYVCCPSKTDPTVAPEGCENIFVLVPVAPGLDDTDDVRSEYYEKVLTHLEELVGEPLRGQIVVKRIYAHREFKEDYNAYKGTALGLTHTLWQTAFMRPRHRSKKVPNLFYTGHYTHPGIGVPMTLISSEIVSKEIEKYYD